MAMAPQKHRAYRRQPAAGSVVPRAAAHKRGYDHAWSEVRKARLALNPFCQRCEQSGRLEWEKLIVDHKIPVRIAPDLRLEIENTQTLCRKCHAIKTAEDEARYGPATQTPNVR